MFVTQVNHEERKTARREARLKESGYGSDRASSDKQVRILSSLSLIYFALLKRAKVNRNGLLMTLSDFL